MSGTEDGLVGAHEKINKAHNLFGKLVEAIQSYKISNACQINSETRYQLNNRYMVVTKVINSSVMLDIADLAHAIRSAMDHIAFTFWREDSGPSDKIKDDRDVSFPITQTKEKFEKRIADLKLKSDISSYLINLGAYEGGPGDWLSKLSAIDNVGKHRELPIAECIYTASGIRVIRRNYENPDAPFIEDVPSQSITVSSSQVRPYFGYSGGMAHDGLILVHAEARPDLEVDSNNAQIKIEVMFGAPFPQHVDVLDTLYEWINKATGILEDIKHIAQARNPNPY